MPVPPSLSQGATWSADKPRLDRACGRGHSPHFSMMRSTSTFLFGPSWLTTQLLSSFSSSISFAGSAQNSSRCRTCTTVHSRSVDRGGSPRSFRRSSALSRCEKPTSDPQWIVAPFECEVPHALTEVNASGSCGASCQCRNIDGDRRGKLRLGAVPGEWRAMVISLHHSYTIVIAGV
jgi:hypothetical protein